MSNLIEFLDKHGITHSQHHKHSRTGWVQLESCPECDSQNYHLGITLDGSRASCYKCGSKRVGDLLKALTGAPWGDIKAVISAGIYVPREQETSSQGTYTPPSDLRPLEASQAACKYLRGRNLDPEYCARVWGFQATGPWSNHPFRVFIPITVRKKPVAWTARAFKGQEPRYQTSAEHECTLSPKRLLYGADKAKGKAIICEGPISAIRLGVGAVATLGVAYTQAQLNLMADYSERYVCFDSSEDAQRRAARLAESLAVFPGTTHILTLDAADPGDITESERELVRKTVFGTLREWE